MKLFGGIATLIFAGSLATAGTIDFGVLAPRADFAAVVDGDAATADLHLGYRTLNADFTVLSNRVSFWNAGYSNLLHAIYPETDFRIMEITLKPLGYDDVELVSFLLGTYLFGTSRTATVFRVTDGVGTTLWSDEPFKHSGPAKKINVGVKAPVLRLLVGADWNLGVNNLVYKVSNRKGDDPTGVPELSSMVLMACGLALALVRVRRAGSSHRHPLILLREAPFSSGGFFFCAVF